MKALWFIRQLIALPLLFASWMLFHAGKKVSGEESLTYADVEFRDSEDLIHSEQDTRY